MSQMSLKSICPFQCEAHIVLSHLVIKVTSSTKAIIHENIGDYFSLNIGRIQLIKLRHKYLFITEHISMALTGITFIYKSTLSMK